MDQIVIGLKYIEVREIHFVCICAHASVFFSSISFVTISFFQNSLHFINGAFATNVQKVLAVTHQHASNHVTKPTASYFLKSPYARLGWLVPFSFSSPSLPYVTILWNN